MSKLPTISSAARVRHPWMADFLLIFTSFLWGANILVFKYTIVNTDAYAFNALRLVFATITLVVMAVLEAMFWPQCRTLRTNVPWGRVLLFCLLNGVIYLLLFVKGISLTTAGNVALIFASLPMWAAFLSMAFLAERLPTITWVGLVVTLLGTVVVTVNSSGEISWSSAYLVGNLFILAATLAWAGATVMSRGLLMILTPLQLAAINSLLTTPIHLLLCSRRLPEAIQEALQPQYMAAMIFSGVFSTGVAYALWNAGVRRVGASYASVYQNVVTLVAVGGGWLFLAEDLFVSQIAGGILTVLGLILMRRGRAQSENSEPNLQNGRDKESS